jgi:hypothetical protein
MSQRTPSFCLYISFKILLLPKIFTKILEKYFQKRIEIKSTTKKIRTKNMSFAPMVNGKYKSSVTFSVTKAVILSLQLLKIPFCSNFLQK